MAKIIRRKKSEDKESFKPMSAAAKKAKARKLRNSPTIAFTLLWEKLRKQQLGFKFNRRKIVYGWIPDFYSCKLRLAIEIDYPSDVKRAKEHRNRDKQLAQYNVEMIRIPCIRIFRDIDNVVAEIKERIEKRFEFFEAT
jgi:very-short-patch-repair endonuclease